jgi:uncharacterized protein
MVPHPLFRQLGLSALLLAASILPVHADVDDGVQKYQKGDFKGAVQEWMPLAQAGDANAAFNLGQAYRLGRGVKQDLPRAFTHYEQAAKLGHVTAQGNLGTLLYFSAAPVQNRKKAVEWWHTAAQNGDSRAQYMLGILYFNGDDVTKDWAKAYAYTSLARDAGLPEAKASFSKMSRHLKADDLAEGDRQKTHIVSARNAIANSAPPVLADSGQDRPVVAWSTASEKPGSMPEQISATANPSMNLPTSQPVARPDLPTVFSGLPAATATATTAPMQVAVVTPPPAVTAAAPAAVSGSWRVQLGAFGTREAAERAWANFQQQGGQALAGTTVNYEPAGSATRLQALGFASKAKADAACASLKTRGIACFAKN